MAGSAKKVNPVGTAIRKMFGVERKFDADWTILEPLAHLKHPHTVLDLGCYRGYFVRQWLLLNPEAKVHAFEPAPDSFAKLTDDFGEDKRVKLINAGVGAESGELEINVAPGQEYFNSFMKPDNEAIEQAKFKIKEELKTAKVPVVTLDDYVSEHEIKDIHLIKVDVQGFEMNVLKGSVATTLPITGHWLIESGIIPLYEGAPKFTEVMEFMLEHNFHLMGMRAYHRGNGVLLETDMLFRRNDLAPDITASGKVYQSVT